MAQDPSFFAQVVEIAYNEETETEADEAADDRDTDKHRTRVSGAAYGLLRQWPRSPGLDPEGKINADLLREWTSQARSLIAEIGRPQMGDIAIGAALAASPAAPDGQWPAPAVCDLLEETASGEIDSGFSTAIFNSRGVVSVPLWEGGQQDRELAEKNRQVSRRLNTRWHRTAAIFSRLADHYDHMALEHDTRVESRHLGLQP